MKKNKGFTLIELLAVIVVLAVIALITTPLILNVIEKSKKGALQDSAYGLIDAANIYYANQMLEGNEKTEFTFQSGEQTSTNKLSYKGKIESGSLKLYSDGKTAVCISEGKYSAIQNVDEKEVKVVSGSCTYNEETEKYETTDKCTEELTNLKKFGIAISSEILEGKTALIQGQEVTGSMKNNSGVTKDGTDVTESGENTLIGVPEAGYYDETSKIKIANSSLIQPAELVKNVMWNEGSYGVSALYYKVNDAKMVKITVVNSGYGTNLIHFASGDTIATSDNSGIISASEIDISTYQYIRLTMPSTNGSVTCEFKY